MNDVVGKMLRLGREMRHTLRPRKQPSESFTSWELDAAARFLEERGWVVLRQVFSQSEIEEFRRDVLASERDAFAGDLLSNPRLSRVLLDDRILRISRALLRGQPTYFGDSSYYSSNTAAFSIGFHKDNPDKFRQEGPDWQSRHPLLRMGIYLQDHTEHSGGLALRDRSHNTVDCTVGVPFAVPSRKGDVVVWWLRTSHSGFVSRLRAVPKVFLPLTVQNVLTVRNKTSYRPPAFLFRPQEFPARLALFMTLGVDGKPLRRYVEYLKTRRYAVLIWKHSHYPDSIRDAAREKSLALIDTPAQVVDVDPATVPEEHREPASDLLPS